MVVEERHDTVADGPAEVKVQTLGQKKKKLAIMDARRWSIHWQTEKQR